jgi:Enoyl-(Acyl carrier protein) reductase
MEAWDTPEHYHELLKLIPYKRIGEPHEIGRAAVWLASDDADYVHGTWRYDALSGLRNRRLDPLSNNQKVAPCRRTRSMIR